MLAVVSMPTAITFASHQIIWFYEKEKKCQIFHRHLSIDASADCKISYPLPLRSMPLEWVANPTKVEQHSKLLAFWLKNAIQDRLLFGKWLKKKILAFTCKQLIVSNYVNELSNGHKSERKEKKKIHSSHMVRLQNFEYCYLSFYGG